MYQKKKKPYQKKSTSKSSYKFNRTGEDWDMLRESSYSGKATSDRYKDDIDGA